MLSAMKANLPWWAKIGAKIVLARVPVAYGFWQRLGLFRHGFMDTAAYALNVFDAHVKRAGLDKADLKGMTILEMGPGDSVATAVIAYAHGASAILVDSGAWAKNAPEAYLALCRLLESRGLPVPDLSQCGTLEDLLRACSARYLTEGLTAWRSIEEESVDFIFSQAVLEHVRKSDFLATQVACYRALKRGGVASHRVDLRDHLGGALNNLRFSEKIWESPFFADSGFYTNRLQMSDILCLSEQAGYRVALLGVNRWQSLPTPKERMHSQFSSLADSALNVSGFDVVLRKV